MTQVTRTNIRNTFITLYQVKRAMKSLKNINKKAQMK